MQILICVLAADAIYVRHPAGRSFLPPSMLLTHERKIARRQRVSNPFSRVLIPSPREIIVLSLLQGYVKLRICFDNYPR